MKRYAGALRHAAARIRAQGLIWATAHTLMLAWDRFFDFILYPLAIVNLGLAWGTTVMMTASLVLCAGLIILYDRLSDTRFRDLLGFETLKEATIAISRTSIARRATPTQGSKAFLGAKISLFFYLSVWFDPMTCTIFMRPTSCYEMTPKFWGIFAMSTIVSNGCWAILMYLGIESVQAIFLS